MCKWCVSHSGVLVVTCVCGVYVVCGVCIAYVLYVVYLLLTCSEEDVCVAEGH